MIRNSLSIIIVSITWIFPPTHQNFKDLLIDVIFLLLNISFFNDYTCAVLFDNQRITLIYFFHKNNINSQFPNAIPISARKISFWIQLIRQTERITCFVQWYKFLVYVLLLQRFTHVCLFIINWSGIFFSFIHIYSSKF